MEQGNSDVAYIFKRSFLGFFWGIIFLPLFFVYFLLKSKTPETLVANHVDLENPYIIGGIIFYMVVAAIYSFVFGHVRFVERIIRLMSTDKDGNMMPSEKSLRLSKVIFMDSVKYRWSMVLKYYWFASLLSIVIVCYFIETIYQFAFNEEADVSRSGTVVLIAAVVALLVWIYVHFFLAAKTRFAWFAYLSHFGDQISHKELFDEVKMLNSVDSKDDRKAMLGYLKRDMIADVSSGVVSLGVDGAVPKGLSSDVAKGYSRLLAVEMAEYSKYKLNFDQFREVFFKQYGKTPELSPKLLAL